MSALQDKPHVFIHPRDRTVLGVKLKDLASDVERELIRSLATETDTAAVWPVFRVIGASDAQIDATLRVPGHRRTMPDGGYHKAFHNWYWRARGETEFFVNGQLTLGGLPLIHMVRRLLSIPELAPAGGAVHVPIPPAPGLAANDLAYAAEVKAWQQRESAEPECQECQDSGEIDWVCNHCDGTGEEHITGLGRQCHQCGGAGGGSYRCPTCADVQVISAQGGDS